ncbi:uncharacterized protein N7473_000095 [Penicillium subrubescens]|uniref:uncharacterized protein n=1 Tax=Penicillium subrubescens TaxID=1316194 RepID=UPI002545A0B3|nr:uncharacterized protein N7473_000095 [Penicillium subrubescens]KAJ5910792.1 hypothetical protein N7473_000095 [Penicillium subrubescens]
MSQPRSQASWPAGIAEVRLEPTDISRTELREEVKGWLLFVREESYPTSTPEDGLRQRRAFIEKWATASQEFRESYYSRAPVYDSALDYPASVLSQLARRPDKRFLLLGGGTHPFETAGAGYAPRCHVPELLDLPARTALYLNQADFHALSMTRRGTVVFADGPDYSWYVIDTPGLAIGQMAIVEFGSNGQVRDSILRRPWNIGLVVLFGEMGRRVADLAESSIGGPPRINEPLDMDRPILELLESTRQSNKFMDVGYGHPDLWLQIIEKSAPGYLELEAQGREVEFELNDLVQCDAWY